MCFVQYTIAERLQLQYGVDINTNNTDNKQFVHLQGYMLLRITLDEGTLSP